jgi:hypothetical protein
MSSILSDIWSRVVHEDMDDPFTVLMAQRREMHQHLEYVMRYHHFIYGPAQQEEMRDLLSRVKESGL